MGGLGGMGGGSEGGGVCTIGRGELGRAGFVWDGNMETRME